VQVRGGGGVVGRASALGAFVIGSGVLRESVSFNNPIALPSVQKKPKDVWFDSTQKENHPNGLKISEPFFQT
jgi:hypothetical protein